MNGDYTDVDTILAEEEHITIQTAIRLYKMGWMKIVGCEEMGNELDSDEEEDGANGVDADLEKESMVSVPLWLAKPLLLGKKCSVSFPKYFDKPFLEKLASHPDAVNLRRETTSHYYEQAYQLANTLPDEAQAKLKEETLNVFTSRIGEIMQSSELTGHDAEETKTKLTNLEKQIYTSSLEERRAKRWLANRNLAGNRFAPYSSADLPVYLRTEGQ